MIPKAGGEYSYLGTAFNDLYAFEFIWAFTFIINPASMALAALTFADYSLEPFFRSCAPPLSARLLLASIAISNTYYTPKTQPFLNCLCYFVKTQVSPILLNCLSTKFVHWAQHAFNAGKISGLLLIVIFGVYSLSIGKFFIQKIGLLVDSFL